jgi:hypothetical protein
MSNIGQPERKTQDRVIALFRDELGYRYLGDWRDREGNSNIEEQLLTKYLTSCGYTPAQISSALYKLRTEADWKITCMLFAPNAPEQNPVEDLWLKGKTYLRKQFAVNKTFAAVKQCFSTFLRTLSFQSNKCYWYWPDPQLI